MSDPTSIKYAHTAAFIAQLGREYPLQGTYEHLNDTQDVEGQVVSNSNDRTDLVKRVVRLLEEEDDEGLKTLVRTSFTVDDTDPALLDQIALDLMHKHKDDMQGVPFVFLSPMKRPISRPSSRASFRGAARPESNPGSPLVKSLSLRRPHTPLASPLSTAVHAHGILGASVVSPSPSSSPTVANTSFGTIGPYLPTSNSSQPSSPLTSPHYLNAKAVEFRPGGRPGSAMSGSFGGRTDTPSPDLWAHRPSDIPNSPRKVSGNLAIASPLGSEGAYYPRPSLSLSRSNSALRSSLPRRRDDDEDTDSIRSRSFKRVDDDEHDEFSPFSTSAPAVDMPRSTTHTHLNQFDDNPIPNPLPAHLQSSLDFPDDMSSNGTRRQQSPHRGSFSSELTDSVVPGPDGGMTPFEVLHSIFGSTVPPATLEEALTKSGYEFEVAMAWLVDHAGSRSPISQGSPVSPPTKLGMGITPVPGSGGRVMTVSRDVVPNMRGPVAPAAAGANLTSDPKYFGQRVAVATGGRVCRYYLAGECRRSDCRFSHDIERALCRFWLRGQCMKGEQCEFLHTLPQDIDVSALTSAMSNTDISSDPTNGSASPPLDAFPTLSTARKVAGGSSAPARASDPSRTRFASAVKKAPVVTPNVPQRSAQAHMGVRRIPAERSGQATPRPSPRLKLRPPSLLPTLATGKVMNDLYMSYRAKAIELGGARNVALTKAAEAWKRGDGASAKLFSRQAHELNTKMGAETAQAAERLVKERAKFALEAVGKRDTGWSDDPFDRSARGKASGSGYGVCLGVASVSVGGMGVGGVALTTEERMESLLDLHGLHSSEGVEVLEEFLLALEREHFQGLAYIVVGEEKHTGTQDSTRGTSRQRLAAGVKEFLHRWQYPWNERDGVVCVDPLTHIG